MKLIRTRQHPLMRTIDVLITLLAWGGLVLLVWRGLLPLLDSHAGPRLETPLLQAFGTLQSYVWVALLNAALLILWARYQQGKAGQFAQRRAPIEVLGDSELRRSFSLSRECLQRLRLPGVLLIHNDQQGGVSEVAIYAPKAPVPITVRAAPVTGSWFTPSVTQFLLDAAKSQSLRAL